MYLNNLDIIILIVIAISTLIAWSRGLVKEVLSIIGWVFATFAIVYLLPILNPLTLKFIAKGVVAGILTSIFILIFFMVCWVLFTGKLVEKIRSSKLSNLDRTLGLFFGAARAFLLVILAHIMVNWMIPQNQQSETLTDSKYFNLAGKFAAPIESLIPADTLESIRSTAIEAGGVEDKTKERYKEKAKQAAEKQVEAEKQKATDELFEKLAQPQIKKKEEAKKPEIKETLKPEGYNPKERQDLDRLIDMVD